jgi:anti-sigma28 factor (negative regulator of flagellin synthesis)
MITTEIVSEIARIMRQQVAGKEVKDLQVPKSELQRHDEVELTETAAKYAHAKGSGSEMEKEQKMKVERLKSLVASGNYKMDEDMVEAIASKIAKLFIKP